VPLPVPAEIASQIGLESGQTWEERLRDAEYESPSKTPFAFEYVEFSRSFEARGTAFEFANVDNAYVQRKGIGARKYPWLCFFSGPDHDKVATAFENALAEAGVGTLTHPMYGKIPNVVPFGPITRRNDLVNEANQSVVEVTFWTTLVKIYPTDARDPQTEIEAAVAGFNVAAAQQFKDGIDIATKARKVSTAATVVSALRDVSATLRAVSDATSGVRRSFDDVYRTINSSIDVLIGQPLLLAQQLSNLIQAPANAAAGIQTKLERYGDFAQRTFGSKAGTPGTTPNAATESALIKRSNDFRVAHLLGLTAVSGSVLSLIDNEFATKPEALKAADDMIAQFDDAVAWSDDGFVALDELDTGESYQALLDAVALCAGFLIQVSFQLVPERQIVLDRNRTIIDLAAELYGNVQDDTLNLIIDSNGLTGSEILELPRGRRIKYYVAA